MSGTALIPVTTPDLAEALGSQSPGTLFDPYEIGPLPRVPLNPEALRRGHRVLVPADTRFKAAARFLQGAAAKLGWSARGIHRALKVARTIADLEGTATTQVHHVAEAMQYRRALRGGGATG